MYLRRVLPNLRITDILQNSIMGITFHHIATKFEELEKISSRNDMSVIISELFLGIQSEDRQILSYLLQGRVAPLFVVSEFNLSEKSILKLLENILSSKGVKYDLKDRRIKLGDVGEVVKEVTQEFGYESKGLLLSEVYDYMWQIIQSSGSGSSERKANLVGEMFSKMSPVEGKYLARVICGELRLGINSKSVLDAFSNILQGDKGKRELLDRVYGINPDLGYVSTILESENNVSTTITPGIPILPRLVERVGSFEEVFERFEGEFLVQPKYDGLRCQIHKYSQKDESGSDLVWRKYARKDGSVGLFGGNSSTQKVKLFTRNLEDVTEMFPEIVQEAMAIEANSFILDSEVLGWDHKKGGFLSYQETMQRRRKYGVKEKSANIPVKAMVFDVLYSDGKDISELDTEVRVKAIKEILSDTSQGMGISQSPTETVDNMERLRKIFNRRVEEGLEGIIVKQKSGRYLPGVRNYEWIKLKKSMEKDLVDTIDLVAVGYYHGSGKRGSLGVGAVLGAIYNGEDNAYEAVCKVGTGFSDELLSKISGEFSEIALTKKPVNVLVENTLIPDVWINPEIVFSVESDEITRNLKADKGIAGGLSLRFPRLIEWGRDKTAEEATSLEELMRLFSLQKKNK